MSANTIITSTVTGGTNSHTTIAEEANAISTDFVSQGVVGAITINSGSGGTGSFCVNADASPDMGVTVKAGQAYITATPSGQDSQVLRARASSDYTAYTINANSSGSTKYDWIYLKVNPTNANNPAADASDVTSIYTSRSSSNSTDNGTPPTYGLLLAVVTVANGASSITNSNISDKRFNASVGAQNGSLIVTQASTGTDAKIQAAGIDSNVNISITPKGTGVVEIGENGSSVSQISASGSDTNIDLKFAPKGTGKLKGVVDNLYNPYKFSAYASATQSLTANTPLKVQFNTENFDTGSNYDNATNYRFTAPIAGFYMVTTQVNIGSSGITSGTGAFCVLYKNGSEIRRSQTISGSGTTSTIPVPSITELVQLAAGDYLEVFAQTSDTSRSVGSGPNFTYFSGFLVSAT